MGLLEADLGLVVLGGGPLQVQSQSVALRPGLVLLLSRDPQLTLTLVKTEMKMALLIIHQVSVILSPFSAHLQVVCGSLIILLELYLDVLGLDKLHTGLVVHLLQ